MLETIQKSNMLLKFKFERMYLHNVKVSSANMFLFLGLIVALGIHASNFDEEKPKDLPMAPFSSEGSQDYNLSREEKQRLLDKFRVVYSRCNFTVEVVNEEKLILNGKLVRSVQDLKAVELEEKRLLEKFARIAIKQGHIVEIANYTLYVNGYPHHVGELKYLEKEMEETPKPSTKPTENPVTIVETEEENLLRRFGELAESHGFKVKIENNKLRVNNNTFTIQELQDLEKEMERVTRIDALKEAMQSDAHKV